MGVPRVDTAPSLAHLVEAGLPVRPQPPAPGTTFSQPVPPSPPPAPVAPGPWPGTLGTLLPALVTLDGSKLPAPTDGIVQKSPPKLPAGPAATQ